jgi:CDP-glucose 4,6-dehydratase
LDYWQSSMEDMVALSLFRGVYCGKRVLLTGHTGFKGAWLTEWLVALGAEVTGFSLPPPTKPWLFEQLDLAGRIEAHHEGDVRDCERLSRLVAEVRPDFVFHLAAQPLVRLSYKEPLQTFAVNVQGTAHVLEAVRRSARSCVVIVVTTDKCYENREWLASYREEDPLGGYDPYSASKAAAELVVGAYRRSFFASSEAAQPKVRLASVRAGNVVGGGDWAVDRIVPDCIRSLARGEEISVRAPNATRPWQHVLEPLGGYLWLGARLADADCGGSDGGRGLESAFNFGPALASNRTVAELVEEILLSWPGRWRVAAEARTVHEAGRLNLATDKAFHLLGWMPVWNFAQTIYQTVTWYREALERPGGERALTTRQLAEYVQAARNARAIWTQ